VMKLLGLKKKAKLRKKIKKINNSATF